MASFSPSSLLFLSISLLFFPQISTELNEAKSTEVNEALEGEQPDSDLESLILPLSPTETETSGVNLFPILTGPLPLVEEENIAYSNINYDSLQGNSPMENDQTELFEEQELSPNASQGNEFASDKYKCDAGSSNLSDLSMKSFKGRQAPLMIDISNLGSLTVDYNAYLHVGKQAFVLVQGDLDVEEDGILVMLMCKVNVEPTANMRVTGQMVIEGGDTRNTKSLVLYRYSNMTVQGKFTQKYGSQIIAYDNSTLHVTPNGVGLMEEGSRLVIVRDAKLIVDGTLEISHGNVIDMQGYPQVVNISGSMHIVTRDCPVMEFKLPTMFISGVFHWSSCGLFKFFHSTVIITGKLDAHNGPVEDTVGIVELSNSRLIVVGEMNIEGGTLVVFGGELLVIGNLTIEEGGSVDVMGRCTVMGNVHIHRDERLVMKSEGTFANNAITCQK